MLAACRRIAPEVLLVRLVVLALAVPSRMSRPEVTDMAATLLANPLLVACRLPVIWMSFRPVVTSRMVPLLFSVPRLNSPRLRVRSTLPVGLNVPPVWLKSVLTVMLPEPPRTPADRFSTEAFSVLFDATVPPLMLKVPTWVALASVAVPALLDMAPEPPVTCIVPPRRLTVVVPRMVVPPLTRCRSSAPALEVTEALSRMSLAALSVRLAAPPAVLLMAVATVMSPACDPVLPVSTVTLVPRLSAAVMMATSIVESSAPGLKFGVCPSSVPVPDWMVTLWGSSSHRPARPCGDDASAARVTSR